MDAHSSDARRLYLRLRSAIHADNTAQLKAVLAEDGQRALDRSAALSLALRANRPAVCAALMGQGVPMKNTQDLNQAISNGAALSVAVVLDAGLSISHVTGAAVMNAIQDEHTGMINVLLERGLSRDRVPKLAYFHLAGRDNIPFLGQLLTDVPPDPDTIRSLLTNAANHRNANLAYCLFEHGGTAHVGAVTRPGSSYLGNDHDFPARDWLLVALSVWQQQKIEGALDAELPSKSAPLHNAVAQERDSPAGLGL